MVSPLERHVDLAAWMAWAAGLRRDLSLALARGLALSSAPAATPAAAAASGGGAGGATAGAGALAAGGRSATALAAAAADADATAVRLRAALLRLHWDAGCGAGAGGGGGGGDGGGGPGCFSDFGLNEPPESPTAGSVPRPRSPDNAAGNVVAIGGGGGGGGGELRFTPHVGYVTLLPLLLELLDPVADGAEVGALLDRLADPAQLWSRAGLRSLSAADPAAGGGENYWRGAVWINMNYLALRALYRTYGGHRDYAPGETAGGASSPGGDSESAQTRGAAGPPPGPHARRAREIYLALRQAVVRVCVCVRARARACVCVWFWRGAEGLLSAFMPVVPVGRVLSCASFPPF